MHKLIQRILDQETTVTEWLLGFSGILMVRFFLEALSSRTSSGIIASDTPTLIHYYLFFLTFVLAFMLFLRYFVFNKEQAHLVPRVAIVAFAAIFIAPIVDYVYTFVSGNPTTMTYIFAGTDNIFWYFLTFFGPNWHTGATIGIRVEVILMMICLFVISIKMGRSILKSFLVAMGFYILVFIFGSIPSILAIIFSQTETSQGVLVFFANTISSLSTLNYINAGLTYSYPTKLLDTAFNFTMAKFFFLASCILALYWLYQVQKNTFYALFKNSRPERVLNYILLMLFGVVLSGSGFRIFTLLPWVDWMSLLILSLSIYFSIMFAISINDISDIKIDTISNPGRPLVKNTISIAQMHDTGIIFLIASLTGAYLSGIYTFFFILSFTSLYYIYSAKPTRLKIIPFLSSFLIGLCCLSVVLAGFFTFSTSKSISEFPPQVSIGIVLIFFLWSHIRDMKDIEGDEAAGIDTVPVIFGKNGPTVVATISSIAYLLVPIFFGLWTIAPAILGSIFNYYFVVKKPYKEKFVFYVYGLFTLSLISIYFLV